MSYRQLLPVVAACGLAGLAVPISQLLRLQASAAPATWAAEDSPRLPAAEDPWRTLAARGQVTLRLAPGRLLLPIALMPELQELFLAFEQNQLNALRHRDPVIRAYAVVHLVASEPRQLDRLRPLLADRSPVTIAERLGAVGQTQPLASLVVDVLCAVSAGAAEHPAAAAARQLLNAARTDPGLLAVRDDVRSCLAAGVDDRPTLAVAFADLLAKPLSWTQAQLLNDGE